MNDYDNGEEEFTAVAGACKQMKFRNSASSAREAYGRFSCNMCANWDGADCRKKVMNSLVSRFDQ